MENQNLLIFGSQLTIIGMAVVYIALTLIIYTLKLMDRLTPWLVKLGGAGVRRSSSRSGRNIGSFITRNIGSDIGGGGNWQTSADQAHSLPQRPTWYGLVSTGRASIMGSHSIKR